jgi:phage FluMu protein Com
MRNIKCLRCQRLLAKADDGLLGGIEFKCSSCKNINYVLLTPKDILATIRPSKSPEQSAKPDSPPQHQFKSSI